MDGFKSIIFHTQDMTFDFDVGGITSFEGAEVDTFDIHVDAEAYGWNHGGMQRILYNRSAWASPLYFRGFAMFDNIDDAKNDYLMEPRGDAVDDGYEGFTEQHIPFGMVIPTWRPLTHEEQRGREQHDARSTLVSVTIIFFWQDND